MQHASRSTRSLFWIVAVLLSLVTTARAEESTPAEGERALASLIRVGVPSPARASVVTTGGVAYGWLDRIGSPGDGGHRLGATLGLAVSPLPSLSIAADVQGRMDAFSGGEAGSETNLYGEPRLTARFSRAATRDVFWGAEADVRLVGAEAPSVHWPATSPSLRGLFAARVADRTWLAAQLGFHLDRSGEIVPDPAAVSGADRRTLATSSYNALQWGTGASYRLVGSGTELVGELSGELLVGSGAPGFAQSPLRVSLGARQPLGRALSVLFSADVGLSSREGQNGPDSLNPAGPRAGAGVSLAWRVNPPPEPTPVRPVPPPEPVVVEPPPPAPPPIPTSSVSGSVVDEGGRPLADVRVTLTMPDAAAREERTFENGKFEFAEVPEGALELVVETPGYDAEHLAVGAGEERAHEIVMHPSVPAGQVRGRVLDLAGQPITATITVTPGDHRVEVQPDGSFELELAPGTYTVRLQHPGLTSQRRTIVVHDRGVVILNIALTR